MESEYRKGYVYIQNHFFGIIAETEEGYIFTYDQDYLDREDAVAVSLTLPLRQEPYETTILFPFFVFILFSFNILLKGCVYEGVTETDFLTVSVN